MKLIPILAAAASIFAASSASAAYVTANFDSVASFSAVGSAYAASGLVFDTEAIAIDGSDATLATPFTAHSGTNAMFSPYNPTVLNVADGFVGDVSFWYSSITGSTTVSVFDGLNATGSVLSSFTLASNSTAYELFSLASQSFSGVGYSISFGGNDGQIAYDDVTVNAVPLPAAALLFPLGAAALGLSARRKRKQA
jgi:hypothetical protein